MFRKILSVTILIVLLLVTAGCGNEEVAVVDGDMIKVEVTNSTEDIIISWAAFFGPGLVNEWGTEMLQDSVIEPGATFVFEIPEGEYDLALFTYEYYIVHNEWAISESIEIEVGGDGKVPVAFVNQSEHDVIQLFMSPTDSDDWGNDLTGDQSGITAETGGWIFFVEPGNYDIMIIQAGIDEPVVSFDNLVDERRTIFIN